jgi:hypothetical protein
MRSSTLGSVMRRPAASRYSKPLPRPRRLMPIWEQSTRLKRGLIGSGMLKIHRSVDLSTVHPALYAG